jgi:hypothetical protein
MAQSDYSNFVNYIRNLYLVRCGDESKKKINKDPTNQFKKTNNKRFIQVDRATFEGGCLRPDEPHRHLKLIYSIKVRTKLFVIV